MASGSLEEPPEPTANQRDIGSREDLRIFGQGVGKAVAVDNHSTEFGDDENRQVVRLDPGQRVQSFV